MNRPHIPDNTINETGIALYILTHSDDIYLDAVLRPFQCDHTLLKIRKISEIGPYDGGGPYRSNTYMGKTGPC